MSFFAPMPTILGRALTAASLFSKQPSVKIPPLPEPNDP